MSDVAAALAKWSEERAAFMAELIDGLRQATAMLNAIADAREADRAFAH